MNSFLKIIFKQSEIVGFVIEKNDQYIEISGDVGEWVDLFKIYTI